MNKGNSNNDKTIQIIAVVIVVVFFLLLELCYSDDTDSDNNSSGSSWSSVDCPENKTWDEMTSSERKACQEYFEDKFESGEWSLD